QAAVKEERERTGALLAELRAGGEDSDDDQSAPLPVPRPPAKHSAGEPLSVPEKIVIETPEPQHKESAEVSGGSSS
ncbi:hypothetical protein TeGR_g2772, partial [Tetraparma gracilis]